MHYKDKKILVVGMGKSGTAVIDELLKLGAKVSVYDGKSEEKMDRYILDIVRDNHLPAYFGREPEDMGYDGLIISPGVPLDIPLVKRAKEADIEIIGELELAYNLCKGKFIAITGTNGKTTTTVLTGEIFKNEGKEAYVVGNIGVAAVSKAMEASENAYMITEVSSFQLETIKEFKPLVSAILNVTPDHLNRHKTFNNYAEAKAQIFKNQDENTFFIVNYDNPEAYALVKNCMAQVIPFSRKEVLEKGCFVKDDEIILKDDTRTITVCHVKELKIPGLHNLENALAAAAIAYWSGISHFAIADTLKTFEGVEHRIEYVDTVQGIRFVNDSKGTNPDASIKAIEAIDTKIILIAGGMDKGSDFEEFIGSFNNKVKYMVLLGETAEKIKDTACKMGFLNVIIKENMELCVEKAFEIAQDGDTVLLSPACASWDMYPNFEARGQHFKDCVKKLGRTLNV